MRLLDWMLRYQENKYRCLKRVIAEVSPATLNIAWIANPSVTLQNAEQTASLCAALMRATWLSPAMQAAQ